VTGKCKEAFMRRIAEPLLILAVLAFSPLVGGQARAQAVFNEGWYNVAGVVDGNTIWLQGIDHPITFAGIAAPGLNQACGSDALSRVMALAGPGRAVYVAPSEATWDASAGVFRAYAWSDVMGTTVTLQELLLRGGVAQMVRSAPWNNGRFFSAFENEENGAKAQHLGIWGTGCIAAQQPAPSAPAGQIPGAAIQPVTPPSTDQVPPAVVQPVAPPSPAAPPAIITQATWVRSFPQQGVEGCIWMVAEWSDGSYTQTPWNCPAGVVPTRPGSAAVAEARYPETASGGCTWYVVRWNDGQYSAVPVDCPVGLTTPKLNTGIGPAIPRA
jgi:endonuclease YncB( thermonuclease family)